MNKSLYPFWYWNLIGITIIFITVKILHYIDITAWWLRRLSQWSKSQTEGALHRCSYKKEFWKYAANLRRTPTSKRNLNNVALQLYWNHTRHWCSLVNLLHIFRTQFLQNTPGGLLLKFELQAEYFQTHTCCLVILLL